jgi:hypothetical protein
MAGNTTIGVPTPRAGLNIVANADILVAPDILEATASVGPDPRFPGQLADIRDAARALAQGVEAQIDELKQAPPNVPDRLARHNDFIAFLEKMAEGLGRLADALDQAIEHGRDGKLEPTSLGLAGQIARQLHIGMMEWLEQNRTQVFDIPIRMGFFGLVVAFLSSIGADSNAAIAGLIALVLRRAPKTGGTTEKPKNRRK